MTLDLDRSVKWYVANFDFKVILINDDQFAILEIAPGRLFFINKVTEEIKRYKYSNGTNHGDVGFHAPDIEKLLERFNSIGTEIIEVEYHEAGWTTIYLKDPDGNFIEIWSGGFGMNNLEYIYRP